jgi:hypothetical protein
MGGNSKVAVAGKPGSTSSKFSKTPKEVRFQDTIEMLLKK